jgi:hypothetical protein
MASRSERLAELRAALLELDACVAKYRGVRVPRAPSAGAPPEAAALAHGAGAEAGAGADVGAGGWWRRIAKRLLRAR